MIQPFVIIANELRGWGDGAPRIKEAPAPTG
jgi:hypothetical protein